MSMHGPDDEASREDLQEEVRDLRARLREAEGVLDAIRYDKVDALVISDPAGEHVRTIESMGVIANSIFDQVVQPVFVLDEDQSVLRANPAATQLCGPDVEGRHLKEVLPLNRIPEMESGRPTKGDVFPADWIRAGRDLLRTEAAYTHPDGATLYFLMDAKVFFLPREEFTGGIVTLVDITSKKRAEIELAVRNQQLGYQFELTTAITDNAAEALVLIDEEGRVIFMNPAAEQLFGCSEKSLVGRLLVEKVRLEEDTEEADFSSDPVQIVGITRVERDFRAMLTRKDGVRLPVQGSVSPVKAEGGRLTGSVLVLRDVSDLKEAERALRSSEEKQRQSQKMEAIGLLAGGIAHDFNNLLTAINGYADLLTATIGAGSAEHEYATEILRAGHRASELTNQLLAFGRKQILATRSLNLNKSIEEVWRMLRRVIGAGIDITMDLDPDAGSISADPVQVEQILLNLAINARDAMPGGGSLVLKTTNVEWRGEDASSPLEGLRPGPFVMLSVRDTGVGMDAKTRERIFEPFFTTKENTGLGLATVYGIMQQAGGRISVSSEPGIGTEFNLYFPRIDPDMDEGIPDGSAKGAAARGDETLLLVEDEDAVRRLVLRILEAKGYNVLAASSGIQALALEEAHDGDIDLLFTDVVMPGMEGPELAGRLRERRPDVTVAYMSGYTDADVFEGRMAEEVVRFIKKPFTSDDLCRFVRDVLDARRASARHSN